MHNIRIKHHSERDRAQWERLGARGRAVNAAIGAKASGKPAAVVAPPPPTSPPLKEVGERRQERIAAAAATDGRAPWDCGD